MLNQPIHCEIKYYFIMSNRLFTPFLIQRKIYARFTHNHVTIYTDGSYMHKFNSGGIGIHFPRNISPSFSGDISENYSLWCDTIKYPPTSNRCELLAIYRAFAICLAHSNSATIYTDSEYAINSIARYSNVWNQNGWKKIDGTPVKNLDLIIPMYIIYSRDGDRAFELKHVKAHQYLSEKENIHSVGNAIADTLARRGASR